VTAGPPAQGDGPSTTRKELIVPRYEFERETRTPHSEALFVQADGREIGRVDIHYGADIVHATLCVPDDFSEDDIQELIAEVDERLVMTALPFRDDFIVTVWIGRQAGVYSEDFEDEYEELEEELDGNGHHRKEP
jgi:hypothetical protein